MQHRFSLPSLFLPLVATLSLVGCDVENESERLADDFELEDDAQTPLAEIRPDDLDLVAAAPEPLAAATNVWAFDNVVGLNSLADGDAVMLQSYTAGYMGCDADGEIQVSGAPNSTNGFVWRVHRTDVDGDGTDELQLELIDSTGETSTYLKMNNDGEVFCGSITGIGDAAAWLSSSTYYVSNGSFYRKVVINLHNFKQDQCIQVSSGVGTGAACTGVPSRTFRIENLSS